MTVFALPDFLVEVNISDPPANFDLSYIQRILFLVLDTSLGTPFEYQKDVVSADDITNTKGVYVKEYFYKTTVKSCDILYVADSTVIDSMLDQITKDEINDRTFTCSIDMNITDPLGIANPADALDFAFFKGVYQFAVFNSIVDVNIVPKYTILYFKYDATPTNIAGNKELVKFGSYFVNRSNFFFPVAPKTIDYNPKYPINTTTEMQTASDNNMSFFAYYNGVAYITRYAIADQDNLNVYYLEQIRRSIQESLFNFLTRQGNTFYTQENLNIITNRTLNAILQYSAPNFGFVNPQGTKVDELILADIPNQDIKDSIVRVTASVNINNVIQKIIVNVSQNEVNV
jgi:hypothetical protein